MNNQVKSQVIEQLKGANNVLVTVSANPTVDELAASVGLTLLLNKMGKHATTVFSGVVPSTIEFLQPEKTIETTTDSLRDFIIALDKSKADKLRYKVEDDVVRIFITPYRATITEHDLDFSHGDFNVDVVIGLGITRREDLDKAITAHGRILHDATVISLTKRESVSDLGAINWQEPQTSSLCEMVAAVAYEMQADGVDGQMATAFLTGIIAETDRFKNEHTTPLALSLSSQLMSSGANQQLIAEKLEEPPAAPIPLNGAPQESASADGELSINHGPEGEDDPEIDNIHIDEHGNLNKADAVPPPSEGPQEVDSYQATDQKTYLTNPSQQPEQDGNDLFGELTGENNRDELPGNDANAAMPMMNHEKVIQPPEDPNRPQKSDKPFDLQAALNASTDMQQANFPTEPALDAQPQAVLPEPQAAPEPQQAPQEVEQSPVLPDVQAPAQDTPAPQIAIPSATEQSTPVGGDTLADLERSVGSTHVEQTAAATDEALKAAQAAVDQAAAALPPQFPEPSVAIGAQPVDLQQQKTEQEEQKPDSPPPVPPPMMPQFYDADGNNNNPFLNPDKH